MSLPLASAIVIQRSRARSALPDAPISPDTPPRRSLILRITESIQKRFANRSLRRVRPTTRKAPS